MDFFLFSLALGIVEWLVLSCPSTPQRVVGVPGQRLEHRSSLGLTVTSKESNVFANVSPFYSLMLSVHSFCCLLLQGFV